MSEPKAEEPRGWLLLTLLLLIVAAVYAPTLGAPLVWDDSRLVLESPEIRRLDLGHAFLHPFWFGAPGEAGSSAFFRPLTSLSFGVDYHLHGDNPAGYHLTNLALHLLNVSALFVLLRRRRLGVLSAFALGACWAFLPRLTEDVAWISGRGDVLAGVFALAALWAYRPDRIGRLLLAGALALCSVFSKESGFAAFVALALLYARAGSVEPGDSARRPRVAGWLALSLPCLLYVVLRLNAGASAGDSPPLQLQLRGYAVLEAVGRYAFMLVDAFRPRTFMGRLGEPQWAFVALGVVASLLGARYLPRLRRVSPETAAYAALALLPVALVVHLVPLPVTVVASDRYLYLPTLGLVLAAANSFQTWLVSRRWLLALPLTLALAFGVRVLSRVGDYGEVATFWLAAARDAPKEAMPLVELGSEAYRAGCFSEASKLYDRALSLHDRTSPHAIENAALVASITGDRERAVRLAELLLRQFPSVASFEMRRATVALAALDFDAARRHAQRALELDPHFDSPRGFLRMLADVQRVWRETEAGSAPAAARLGVEMRSLRYPEATQTLRQLLQAPPSDEKVVREGLVFVLRIGRAEDAAELLPLYLAQHRSPAAATLEAAVKQRVETATALRARLRELAL